MSEMKISCIPATKNRRLDLNKRQATCPDGLSLRESVRVAAYCRVSTMLETQEGSFEFQKKHFEELIKKHPNWTLVEVYGDYGKSGTSIKCRPQFQRMIQDAEDGKIDYILTKSVSRFGRNRSEVFEIVDRFKRRSSPIGIYFESGGIDSLDPKSNMILAILAILAQEQSQIISENVRWSIEKKCRQGCPPYNPAHKNGVLGYAMDEKKKWYIVESEAEIIRRIFAMYIKGIHMSVIAEVLNSEEVPTRRGNTWNRENIRSILYNEKYIGEFKCFKRYKPDVTSHYIRNDGYRESIYIKNHHPAIIDQKEWLLAQIWLKLRSAQYSKRKTVSSDKSIVEKTIRKNTLFDKIYYKNEQGAQILLKKQHRLQSGCSAKLYYTVRVGGGMLIHEITIEQCFMEVMYLLKAEQRIDKSIPSLDMYYLIAYEKLNKSNRERGIEEELEQLQEEYETAIVDYEKVKSVIKPESHSDSIHRYLKMMQRDIDALNQEIVMLTELKDMPQFLKNSRRKIQDMISLLPLVNGANEKLNIIGLDICENIFRDSLGEVKKGQWGSYNAGRMRITEEKFQKSPDILRFNPELYYALVDHIEIVDDSIQFHTIFGQILVNKNMKRKHSAFLGYRHMTKEGYMRLFTSQEEIVRYMMETENENME